MSSTSSHRPEKPEPAQPTADGDPFVDSLAGGPAAFLDPKAPNTDSAPTVISRNAIIETGALKGDPNLMESLRGRKLAHFELLEPIGVGGMAAVLRARDTQLDRTVALKILPPDMAADQENVRRFHQEARAAARLDHENIARVFFCGEDQRLHFIAFEYVDGDNLRALLERRGRLPVKEAVHYMLQIAAGLAHASERGVVHRDIKPSNIIITPDGRAKLVDMGLARSMHVQSKDALTQSGVTLGTFDYISPEQALEPRDADVRSDIYSMGCTFYHALTGQSPVPEGTAAKKLHHHQHVLPVDPRQLNPEVPDTVTAILARMMAKDPKNRYQRPEHLVQHLLQTAQELGSPTEIPAGMLYVDVPLPTAPRKRPGLMVGLALAGLAAALVLLAFAPSEPDRRGLGQPVKSPSRPNSDPGAQAQQQPNQGNPAGSDENKHPVTSTAALAKALARSDVEEVKLGQELSLAGGGEVLLHNRSVALAGAPTNDIPKLTRLVLNCNSTAKSGAGVRAGVVVDGGKVVFRHILFDMKADHMPAHATFAAVLLKNGAEVTFDHCVFAQDPHWDEPADRKRPKFAPMTSVLASNPASAAQRPRVVFNHCLFARGQDAVAVDGAADVHSENCAFGPHRALFHLCGEASTPATSLKLARCTALIAGGPMLRIDNQAACALSLQHSLFVQPAKLDPRMGSSELDLIRQTDEVGPLVTCKGFHGNYYGNLNAYWVRGVKDKDLKGFYNLKDFQAELKPGSAEAIADNKTDVALPRDQYPLLSTDPLQYLVDQLGNAKLAFQLNPALPQFQSLSAQAPTVGVAQCAWGETNNAADFKAPPTVVAKAEPFVVDPELPDNANQPGYFPTLESAVAVAETKKDDTVILIKSNDLVRVQSVRLKKTSRTVTVRPYEGYRPVLTLDTEGAVGDAALFEVHRGTIVLKDLSVLLHPERKEPAAQSVIALGCQGQCRFEGCLITLRPKHKEVSLSGVTFAGPVNGGNEPKVPGPRVELVDSLVRGEGVFLNFGKALPFELDAKNSLVFLSGSLVQAQINYPVKNVMVGKSTIKLSRCTFYTREPLLQLSDEIKGDGGLITTTVLPSDCMFTTDASPLPLLQFTSSSSAATVGKLYGWGGVHNVYCGFDTILYQSGSSGGAALDVKKSAWQMKESMDGTHFLEKTFDFQTVGDPVLADIRPEDVQTMVTDLHKHLNDNKGTVLVNNYGANLGQLKEILPLPKVTAPLAPKAPEETGLVKP